MLIFNSIIILFIVLMFASLSGLFAERSGTVNIGINGMMLVGSLSYWFIQKAIPSEHGLFQIVYLLISILSGVITGLLFSFAAISLKANQIISGTAVNMIAAAISMLLLGNVTASDRLILKPEWAVSTDSSKLNHIFSLPVFLGIIVLIIAFISLKYTAWGLRLKTAGENPHALDSKGISVIKTRYIGIIISGILASIGGAIFVQERAVFSGNVQGLGFVGLTILIAGQWKIHWMLLAAITFASIFSVANNLQIIKPSLSEIKPLMQTIPFVLSLAFLVIFSKKSLAPAASGVAYDKTKR